MNSRSRPPGLAGAAMLLALACLLTTAARAADYPSAPPARELWFLLSHADSAVVESALLPDSGAAEGRLGANIFDARTVRTRTVMDRAWAKSFADSLLTPLPAEHPYWATLVRAPDDTSAVLPVVELFLAGRVARIALSFHEDCALVFLPQGLWGGVSLVSARDRMWALLRPALARDPLLATPEPPARWNVRASHDPHEASPFPEWAASSRDHLPAVRRFDTFASTVEKTQPEYPDAAIKRGVQGEVRVAVLIGADGYVEDTYVVWSIPMLNDAAIRAVKSWRFTPATLAGRPVASWAVVPVSFRLH